MNLINWMTGYIQILLGVLAVVALYLFDRRAGYLMAIGSVSSLLDNLIKLVVSRQSPPGGLVRFVTPATGHSYPSGHAVFFTWMSFMLAASIAPRVNPRFRPIVWIIAAVVVILTCIARVWHGDHWPSDVIGGVLLGAGWSAFVLWLPERWLPWLSWSWFLDRSRRTC